MHFLVSFDLIPGHAICLSEQLCPYSRTAHVATAILGSRWLSDDVANPLTDESYEIMLYSGRAPTLTAPSGGVIYYVEKTDHADQSRNQIAREDDEGSAFLQLHARQMNSNCESKQAPTRRSQEADVSPRRFSAVDDGRETLQLFPHLEESLPFDEGQPVPEPTVEEFLAACQRIQLATFIPEEVFARFKPISQFLSTCRPFQDFSEMHPKS